MAIEKRVIKRQEIGYDTEKRSYFKLPTVTGIHVTEYQGKMFDFPAMTDEQLSEYAAEKGVDISRAKTREAAIAKLEKAEQGTE